MNLLQYLGCGMFTLVMVSVLGLWVYDYVKYTKQF